MARHEKDFEAAFETELPRSEAQSLAAAGRVIGAAASREDALARFLSAEEGWVEAARRLGGAFAPAPAGEPDGKDI